MSFAKKQPKSTKHDTEVRNGKKTRNLLYSLPDILISKIFGLDPTHHDVFSSLAFKKEIKENNKNCVRRVTEYIDGYIDSDSRWRNDYGYTGACDEISAFPVHFAVKKFKVALEAKDNVLFFKVLPINANAANCPYLKNPSHFDGYFAADLSEIDEIHIKDQCLNSTIPIDIYSEAGIRNFYGTLMAMHA